MKVYLYLLLKNLFINNLFIIKYLGICPIIYKCNIVCLILKKSITFSSIAISNAIITYILFYIIKKLLNFEYLDSIYSTFINTVLIQFIEITISYFLKKQKYSYEIFCPTISYYCINLFMNLLICLKKNNFIQSLFISFIISINFIIILILFVYLQNEIFHKKIPKHFQKYPILLITIGILAISFIGFK